MTHSIHRAARWPALIAGAGVALAALMSACGGVDSGGTGMTEQTSASGRISGFGSIIVNAVRFDDSSASIVDDDGVVHASSDLKLGMVVQVDAGPLSTDASTGGARGTAKKIQFGHEIAGPVEMVDATAGTLMVLGQAVRSDADTVYEGFANGLSSVLAGDLVEVHAFFDPQTGVYAATRIEHESALPSYQLRGLVSDLDTTARTLRIGQALIAYGSLPPGQDDKLANGTLVRATLQTTQVAGRWVATQLRVSRQNIAEGAEAEVEGFVSNFVSLASFKVQGTAVDASGASVSFENGAAADLANGVRVEVEGRMVNGVLVARRVELRKLGPSGHEFELHGNVEVVDAVAQTFKLRGVLVSWNGSTQFSGGTAASLVTGAAVEVRGNLSQGGTRLMASRIKIDKP